MASSGSGHSSTVRNIGVIAHIDAGKTTLSERMLFYTSKIHRLGEVHDGTATMDFMPEERERGITIASACISCTWNGHVVNIIDTPGHVDFTIEVERSLRVLDGAVGVFCAVSGVEPQSETVWKQSEQFGIPKIAFINKMDRPGADFEAALTALEKRLGVTPLALTVPLGSAEEFSGIIDIIAMQRLVFDQASLGREFTRDDLEEEQCHLAEQWRERMLETLADTDDVFFEAYLSGSYSEEDIHAAVRRATVARKLTPVLAGSALRNTGVQPLLDAICRYLPSPGESGPVEATAADSGEPCLIYPDPKNPLTGLVFKVVMESGHKLAFVRLYAGTLREGDSCQNVARKTTERVSRIYVLEADHREQVATAVAGDIVACVGLRSVMTGDTIAAPGQTCLLERIETYEPVISRALEPLNADEGKTLDEALERYGVEDPTLTVSVDEGSGHRIISGMGELHLDVLLERMRREYGIAPRAGNPQVIRRETVARESKAEAEFDRELGTVRHHGALSISLLPLARGSGNRIEFAQSILAAVPPFPVALREAVRQGLEDTLLSGPATGYPVQDVAVTVTGLSRKEGVSTAPGFQMAAGMALRDALDSAGPVVLEPIMAVEISVPDEWLGSAIGLFNSLGGKVENIEERAALKCMHGLAPLGRLFGFSTSLRSATQGRAGLVMRFDSFDTI